ncbi:unnamed protein product [Amoebophrya sp. A25]|nr:unnamed protein product [Amoebophrya sp. A25]|eukprot:GSA25T00013303001.1
MLAHEQRQKKQQAQASSQNEFEWQDPQRIRFQEALWVDEACHQASIDERLNTLRGRVTHYDKASNSMRVRVTDYVSDVEKRLMKHVVSEAEREAEKAAEKPEGSMFRGGGELRVGADILGQIVAQSKLKEMRIVEKKNFVGKVSSSGHSRAQVAKEEGSGDVDKISARIWMAPPSWTEAVRKLESTAKNARSRESRMRRAAQKTHTIGDQESSEETKTGTEAHSGALHWMRDMQTSLTLNIPRNLTPRGAVLLDAHQPTESDPVTLWLEGVGDCHILQGRKDVLVDFFAQRGSWRKKHVAIGCAPRYWDVPQNMGTSAATISFFGKRTENDKSADVFASGSKGGGEVGEGGSANKSEDDTEDDKDLAQYDEIQVSRRIALTKEETERVICEDLRTHLNREQLDVVRGILSADCSFGNPMLVWGPPGTGKSFTLQCALWKVLEHLPDVKVLVCAPSNKAADLLLVGLQKKIGLPKSQLIRVNSRGRQFHLETHLPEVPQPLHQDFWTEDELAKKEECKRHKTMLKYSTCDTDDVKASHRIVVTTATAAANLPSFLDPPAVKAMKPVVFVPDLVIVDEAGQCTEPDAYMPLSLNPRRARVVLCGDHKQLRPTVPSSEATGLRLNTSMLERLASDRINRESTWKHAKKSGMQYTRTGLNEKIYFLTKTFRSHPELTTLWNVFYSNTLVPVSDRANTVLRFPRTGSPALFHDLSNESAHAEEMYKQSYINQLEAHLVCKYILHELADKMKTRDVGVITFYDAQVKLIQQKLNEHSETGETYLGDVEVGTAEYFQGSEKRVIIISCVRSSSIGFLNDEKRLNVALSRAQDGMIVLGAFAGLLVQDNWWKKVVDTAQMMGCLYQPSGHEEDEGYHLEEESGHPFLEDDEGEDLVTGGDEQQRA